MMLLSHVLNDTLNGIDASNVHPSISNVMRHCFVFYLLLMLSHAVWAQHESEFTIVTDKNEGCPNTPLTLQVETDVDTAGMEFIWDFGNGEKSEFFVAEATYDTHGYFDISLKVKKDGEVYANLSVDSLIHIFKAPVYTFEASETLVCREDDVDFAPIEVDIDETANIVAWSWDFSGGELSYEEYPTFAYSVDEGKKTIRLKVVDNNGCIGIETKPDYITVLGRRPNLSIVSDKSTFTCDDEITLTFTNTSEKSLVEKIWWDFNDGSPIVEEQDVVTHTFKKDQKKTYSVKLNAKTVEGCISNENVLVVLDDYEAGFIAASGENKYVPEVNKLCAGDVLFVPVKIKTMTDNQHKFEWDFDNDGVYEESGEEVFHNYKEGGTFSVGIKAYNSYCEDESVLEIEVEEPLDIGIAVDTFRCEPSMFQYEALYNVPLSYTEWRFNNRFIDTVDNAVSIERMNLDKGVWEDELYVISENGCIDSVKRTIEIPILKANMKTSSVDANGTPWERDIKGCIPVDALFKDSSEYAVETVEDKIISYSWDFGESGIDPLQGKEINETVVEDGWHKVWLAVETERGCVDTSYKSITVGYAPEIKFNTLTLEDCASGSFIHEITSEDSLKLTAAMIKYHNLWGDPAGSLKGFDKYAQGAERVPRYLDVAFSTDLSNKIDTGYHFIEVMYEYNYCQSSEVYMDELVNVLSPVARLVYEFDCESPLVYNFSVRKEDQGLMLDADHWTWDFGDGTRIENSTEEVMQHVYEKAGDYYVHVTAHKDEGNPDNCSYTHGFVLQVRTLDLEIAFPEGECPGELMEFSFKGTTDGVNASLLGEMIDSVYFDAAFDFRGNETFADSSQFAMLPYSGNTHEDTLWYYAEGMYDLTVSARAVNGCVDTVRGEVLVTVPKPSYDAEFVSSCPLTTLFYSKSTDLVPIVDFNWKVMVSSGERDEFGELLPPDTTYFSGDSVYKTGIPVGNHQTLLSVKNKFGCESQYDSIVGIGETKVITEVALESEKVCIGNAVAMQSANTTAPEIIWDFGDGSPRVSSLERVEHVYADTGSYEMRSYIINYGELDENGVRKTCTDSSEVITIDVRDPNIEIHHQKDTFLCVGQVLFDSIPSEKFSLFSRALWEMENPDGTMHHITSKNTNQITFNPEIYTDAREYKIRFTALTDYLGCEDVADSTEIFVSNYKAELRINDSIVCVDEQIEFSVEGEGFDKINYWVATGNGRNMKRQRTFTYAYQKIEDIKFDYTAKMYFGDPKTTEDGCRNEKKDSVLIKLHEEIAYFKPNLDDDLPVEGCAPFAVQFDNRSEGATEYRWDFGDGSPISTEENPVHVFAEPGKEYKVTLHTSSPKCNESYESYIYTSDAPLLDAGNDTLICEGSKADFLATADDDYLLEWAPAEFFADVSAANAEVYPEKTTDFYVSAVHEQTKCKSVDTVKVVVVHAPEYTGIVDTNLIIYDRINLRNNSEDFLKYSWTPSQGLSCDDCASPDVFTEYSQEYELKIEDIWGCHSVTQDVYINVLDDAVVALPKAFTPNDDGENDMLYARGWGVKEFVELKVFNRWGQLIFTGNSWLDGWDGTFNGEAQPAEVYTYIVKVLNFKDEEKMVSGHFNILR